MRTATTTCVTFDFPDDAMFWTRIVDNRRNSGKAFAPRRNRIRLAERTIPRVQRFDGMMFVSLTTSNATLRQNSGGVDRSEPLMVPDLNVISGAPAPGTEMKADRNRPFIITVGKHLRGVFDRMIASSSLVANDPVLDVRDFPWTQMLRENWETIRDEAKEVALRGNAAPSLSTISPDHRSIAEVNKWRSFFIWGYGYRIDENADRCPRTAALVERIPGLNSAFFSILAPGTHIPDHRGVTKGLITCHLGLVVPRDGDVRMRVHDRIVRWAEGETLVFDDTYQHEVWNDTQNTRVVLLIQFERPLRNPGKWIADFFLGFVRRSAFVQEARDNISTWNAAVKQLDV